MVKITKMATVWHPEVVSENYGSARRQKTNYKIV